ncbi:MAG: lipopolysaccharide biosynthesis protein [Promethearchaeota archaeon]
MNDSVNKRPLTTLDHQYKLLAKNTLFSIFQSYGSYIFTIITSFLIARMISREEWAFLILATSIIGIFSLIINFLPPGLIFSLNFYIPRYRAKNKLLKLRNFVLKAFYMRMIITTVIFLITITIFSFFESVYNVFLNNHVVVLYILSPIIIISSLDTFFTAFLIGFNLFRINFIFFIIKSVTQILPLFVFFFLFRAINIEIIALINLVSLIIPIILEFLIFISKIPKIKSKDENGLNFKKITKKVIGYGSFLRIESTLSGIWGEVQTQAIGIFESTKWVTGNNISRNYTNSSTMFLNSLNNPLIYSLSSLDYKEKYDKIIKMFKTIFNYSLFTFLFITGILFFVSDFFLSFVYSEIYVEFSSLLKLMLVSKTISIYPILFGILLRTTNRIKIMAIITAIFFPLHISFVFIGLLNFGIYGIYFASIIINTVLLIGEFILTTKLLKFKLNINKIILQYTSFLIAIFLTILLGNLIFKDLSYQFWLNTNLLIFEHLNLLDLLTFVVVFFLLNRTFKIFTKSDIEYIEKLFTKDKISHKYINKLLRFLKKFLR